MLQCMPRNAQNGQDVHGHLTNQTCCAKVYSPKSSIFPLSFFSCNNFISYLDKRLIRDRGRAVAVAACITRHEIARAPATRMLTLILSTLINYLDFAIPSKFQDTKSLRECCRETTRYQTSLQVCILKVGATAHRLTMNRQLLLHDYEKSIRSIHHESKCARCSIRYLHSGIEQIQCSDVLLYGLVRVRSFNFLFFIKKDKIRAKPAVMIVCIQISLMELMIAWSTSSLLATGRAAMVEVLVPVMAF